MPGGDHERADVVEAVHSASRGQEIGQAEWHMIVLVLLLLAQHRHAGALVALAPALGVVQDHVLAVAGSPGKKP